MKKNRKINLCRRPSHRVLSGAIATLFAVSFTASAAGNAKAKTMEPVTSQAGKTAAASQRGTVTGTLTLDGKAIPLGYIHAQRREARPSDAERFKLKDDEKLEDGVIDLIVTNIPLTENTINEIIEDKYRGSTRTRGIWLIIDSSRKRQMVRNFLVQSGTVAGFSMGMLTSRDDARIERGRMIGKLECKIEEVTTVKMYTFSFDAPMKIRPFETKTPRAAVTPDQFLKDFQKIMPGRWTIERWWSDSGNSHRGTLSVDEKLDEEKFRGTLHINVRDGVTVEEEVIITRQGTKIHFQGRVAPGTKWNPDIMDFELRGDLLVGGGRDTAGSTQDVVLRKIP